MHFSVILAFVPFLICTVLMALSCVGRWMIFSKSGHPGILSLIPVVNLVIYGKIGNRLKAVTGIFILSIGMSLSAAVLGAVLRKTVSLPDVRMKAAILCTSVMAVIGILMFVLYIRLIFGVCEALSLSKPLFVVLALFFFPLTEFLGGIMAKGCAASVNRDNHTPSKVHKKENRTSSLEGYLDNDSERDELLEIWDSGAIVFKNGLLINRFTDTGNGE